jgi:hypothetical protein
MESHNLQIIEMLSPMLCDGQGNILAELFSAEEIKGEWRELYVPLSTVVGNRFIETWGDLFVLEHDCKEIEEFLFVDAIVNEEFLFVDAIVDEEFLFVDTIVDEAL